MLGVARRIAMTTAAHLGAFYLDVFGRYRVRQCDPATGFAERQNPRRSAGLTARDARFCAHRPYDPQGERPGAAGTSIVHSCWQVWQRISILVTAGWPATVPARNGTPSQAWHFGQSIGKVGEPDGGSAMLRTLPQPLSRAVTGPHLATPAASHA